MSTTCANKPACRAELADIPERRLVTRDQWAAHPNYPAHVLLLGSHDNFRHISRLLISDASSGGAVRPLGVLYMRWRAGMRNHEAYEEGKLYPFLRRRFCVSTDDVQRGHKELHEADERVRAALSDLVFGGQEHADDALYRALLDHDRILRAHLALEEELVIPLLLGLSRDEFQEYYHTPAGQLMARLEARSRAQTSDALAADQEPEGEGDSRPRS